MYFAALRVGGAAGAVPVAGDDGFDLGLGGESTVASYSDGLSFAVEDDPGNSGDTH